MNESEVLDAIAHGETAYGLLLDADPKLEKRFRRMCRTMKTFLEDVRQHFPDATYYTASGGFNLLLGNSHDDKGHPQSQLSAIGDTTGLIIGDGDY